MTPGCLPGRHRGRLHAPCGSVHRESNVLLNRKGDSCMVTKTAVVTGGASGIGQAIAVRLAKDGYQVATLDLNPSESEFAYVANVTDRSQVDAALQMIRQTLGPVTILVNAAGIDGFKKFTEITFEEWQRVIDVNLNGVFHCIQAALPDMLDAG